LYQQGIILEFLERNMKNQRLFKVIQTCVDRSILSII
jgi:hypothetical protein